MAEIREVLYQHYQGAKQRGIEKSLGVSRNSIRKVYFDGDRFRL